METEAAFVTYPETAPNYIPEDILTSELYINSRQLVLRCLASLRLEDRRAAREAGETFDESVWRPDAERLYHLGDETNARPLPVAHRIGRFLGMAENMARYREGIEHIGLRPEDQIEPFEALLSFYHPAELGEQLPLDVTLAHVIGGAYGKMATGWGKMTVMAKYAEAAGIGQHPFNDPNIPPYKALILAGDKINLTQLIGKEVYDGFAKFAPNVKVTQYSGKEKNLTGDGVVMSYLMFERASKEERYDLSMFDIVLPDEAHHLHGSGTRAAHEVLRQAGVPTMAVTATPDYRANRKLRQILPYELCDINKRDLIELGTLSAVKLFWVTTGKAIHVKQRRGDYTDQEVAGLAHDDERNAHILEWTKMLVEDVGQVVVTSIRGDKCWHAEHLASTCSNLEQYKIMDEKTGELRQIIGKAVHGYMSDKEADAIMQDWERDAFDVLFLTDKFRESWNTKRVGAMVFAAPTTSLLVMDQWTGRAVRMNPNIPVKVLVHMDDMVVGHKPKVTPYHVLGEMMIEQGKILGSPKPKETVTPTSTSGRNPKVARRLRAIDDYPEHLRGSLQVEGLLLHEVELTARAGAYESPPEDYIPVKDTAHLWRGQDFAVICDLLEKNGYPYILARGRRGPMRHVHRDAGTFLESYKLPDLAPRRGVATAITAGPQCGISYDYFVKIAQELGLKPKEYRTRKSGRVHEHYTDDQIVAVREHTSKNKMDADKEEAVRAIGAAFGLHVTCTLYYASKIEGDPIVTTLKRMGSGQDAITVRKIDAARIRTYLRETEITSENGRQPLPRIMAAAGVSRTVAIKWAAEMAKRGHLSKDLRKGRWCDAETGAIVHAKFLEAADAHVLARAIVYSRNHGGTRYEPAPKEWTEGAPVLLPMVTKVHQPPVKAAVKEPVQVQPVSTSPAPQTEPPTGESPASLMVRMQCTAPAMQYLIGVAGIQRRDIVTSPGGEVLFRDPAIKRLTALASTASRSVAESDWISNTMFAVRIGVSSEKALQEIRKRVAIMEGEIHIAVAPGGGEIDIWYCQALWQRANSIFRPTAKTYTGREY